MRCYIDRRLIVIGKVVEAVVCNEKNMLNLTFKLMQCVKMYGNARNFVYVLFWRFNLYLPSYKFTLTKVILIVKQIA